MSTRLLLIGDLHIREGEQRDDIEASLAFAAEVARERNVYAVLLAGDEYEGRSSPAERMVAGNAILELGDLGERPVLIVKGNHDQPGDLDVFAGYPEVHVAECPRWFFLGTIGGGLDVLMLPWPEKAFLAAAGHAGAEGDQAGNAALAAMLRGMVANRPDPGRPFIVLGHLSVLGAITSSAQPLVGQGIEAVLGDLQDLGASFVALGHVHKPQQLAPGVEYIGSLTVHDFGEEAEEKRIGILTVEDDGRASVEWIPVPCRRWVTIDAHPSGLPDPVALEDVSGGQPWQEDYPGWNVRYHYHCAEEEQALFDHAAIARRFAAVHTLKIVPDVQRTERVRAAEVAAAQGSEAKLRAWGTATGTEIAPSLIDKLHQLEGEAQV
jgi:DNA repair protein SbcD/Mre11